MITWCPDSILTTVADMYHFDVILLIARLEFRGCGFDYLNEHLKQFGLSRVLSCFNATDKAAVSLQRLMGSSNGASQCCSCTFLLQ